MFKPQERLTFARDLRKLSTKEYKLVLLFVRYPILRPIVWVIGLNNIKQPVLFFAAILLLPYWVGKLAAYLWGAP